MIQHPCISGLVLRHNSMWAFQHSVIWILDMTCRARWYDLFEISEAAGSDLSADLSAVLSAVFYADLIADLTAALTAMICTTSTLVLTIWLEIIIWLSLRWFSRDLLPNLMTQRHSWRWFLRQRDQNWYWRRWCRRFDLKTKGYDLQFWMQIWLQFWVIEEAGLTGPLQYYLTRLWKQRDKTWFETRWLAQNDFSTA